jgi:penicillin-binding protein 1A
VGTPLAVLAAGLLAVGGAVAAPFALYGGDLPDVAPLIAEARRSEGASALPPHLVQAFIAAQDRRFLSHAGFDSLALARAAGETAAPGGAKPSGGATLTQQLVKNTALAGEAPSIRRKVREILLSRRIEAALGKDQIMSLYLERVYFGGGAWGIEAAARRYFGRAAGELTVGQAAYLASVVDAPQARRIDREANRPRALAARAEVIERMARAGFLTPSMVRAARAERL